MNFVAIDFETADKHYICSVGIVTVENAQITETFHSLIKPPGNVYHYFCTKVHGLTSRDTKEAAPFIEVYPEIKKRLSNKIVVAHNESFDRNVLKKSMYDNGLDYDELQIPDGWECTMKECKACNKYPSGKLNDCCEIEGIELNHHEALSDAKACAELYLKLKL